MTDHQLNERFNSVESGIKRNFVALTVIWMFVLMIFLRGCDDRKYDSNAVPATATQGAEK